MTRNSSGDEIPERDVIYIILSVYLLTTELLVERHTYFRNILLHNAYLLHIMDLGFLPAERDKSVIHRLRSADKLPHIYARTNRFKNSYLFLC